jgi:hypothetical protein
MRKSHRPVNPDAARYRLLAIFLKVANSARRSTSLVFAFVIGIWVNAASDPGVQSFNQLLRRIYDPSARATAWIAIIATAILMLLPLLRLVFQRGLRRADFAVALSETLDDKVDVRLTSLRRGRIAWGSQLVLLSCPRIQEGWAPSQVEIHKSPDEFYYPASGSDEFAQWAADDSNKNFREGRGLRLTEVPSAFTDDNYLRLRVQPNRFRDVMFYNRNVVPGSGEPEAQAQAVVRGIIDFPHCLCMHAVIVTKDNWILLTKRSRSVAYWPGAWSCSIEEQLAERDFEGTQENIAEAWATRMLNEELGLRNAETRSSDIRILGVFLETDIVNIGVVALIYLEQDKSVLDAIIGARTRQDYEFTDWKYIRWDALPQELMKPTLDYHPSSGLRMFMAGIVHFGSYEFGVALTRAAASPVTTTNILHVARTRQR